MAPRSRTQRDGERGRKKKVTGYRASPSWTTEIFYTVDVMLRL